MKRAIVLLVLLFLPTTLFADEAMRRYLVATRRPAREAARAVLRDDLPPRAFRDVREFQEVDGFAVDLTDAEARSLARSPRVRYVEPDREVYALSDNVVDGQQITPYGVSLVNAPGVWSVTRGQSLDPAIPVRLAVLDTGIAYDDPELTKAYKGGFNTLGRTDNPLDDQGHGTHVAGTIAAADDGAGVVGVAPEVELFAIKVLNQCGSGNTSNIIAGVDWLIQKKKEIGGNWIMSLSLGSSDPNTLEQEAFQRAADAGILTFAAAGNSYDSSPVDGLSYPAGYPTVVSVGAVDSEGKIASFSQRGADLKLVAPGVDVLSTFVAESLTTDDGRSYTADQMTATNASTKKDLCLPRPVISGEFVFCGFGGNLADFPPQVNGKIALIERGNNITFAVKAKNAKAAGAIAAVIFNNVDGAFRGTVGELTSSNDVPLTVSLSRADGLAIKATPNAKLTLSFGSLGYANLNGTSMSTPHASGVAALAWAVAPSATAEQITQALLNTATDLGNAGFDTTYGFGLVNALEAAKSLAPGRFIPAQPQKPVPGRRALRRGQ